MPSPHWEGTPLYIPTQRARGSPKPCDQWSKALTSLPLLPHVSFNSAICSLAPHRHQHKAMPGTGHLLTGYCSKLPQKRHWAASWLRRPTEVKGHEEDIMAEGRKKKKNMKKNNPRGWSRALQTSWSSYRKASIKGLKLQCQTRKLGSFSIRLLIIPEDPS